MTVTYTFAQDISIAELRGVTVTGGKFERRIINKVLTDVCVFEPHNGKGVMAGVKGKPELEAALAAQKTGDKQAVDAKRAGLEATVPGFAAWDAASAKYANAAAAYDRASERGYPVREAADAEAADQALQAVFAQYPATALWSKIIGYTQASNYSKSAVGDTARKAVEAGQDIVAVAAKMEADWSAAAKRAVDNS